MDVFNQYLKQGFQHSKEFVVKKEELASNLKTGDIEYIATPSLIIFMEKVICELIHERIPEMYTSVSAEINIKHLLPIGINEKVSCSVHLKFIEGEKLFFDFAFFKDNKDIIAIGAHERFIVKKDEFPD